LRAAGVNILGLRRRDRHRITAGARA
jgi:hypothetical protein